MIKFQHKYSSIKLLAMLASISVLSACSESIGEPTQIVQPVHIETVISQGALMQRNFAGRVEAVSTVNVSFQVAGHLTKLSAQEGEVVFKGDLLAQLDRRDFELSVQRAKAQHHQNKLDVMRKRSLFKSRALSKAELDRSETVYKLSYVALETALRNLSYTRITAPFDALVSQRLIDNFTNINAHQSIVRLQELTELRVKIDIPQNLIKLLDKKGEFNAEAIFADRPEKRFPLVYREHVTEAGDVAQTYEVIFGLSRQGNQHVLPGMIVGVIISKNSPDSMASIFIPLSAIDYKSDGQPRVWIFDPQKQRVFPQSVTLGPMQKKRIAVLSGLKESDQIVIAGVHLLREDMPVRRFVSF